MGEITQTDFGYTFQRGLPGTGLMDYRARFYAPALGRFIQPDSIVPGTENPQAWNRYSYVLNSPLDYIDPTGHDPHWCKDASCRTDYYNSMMGLWRSAHHGGSGGGGNDYTPWEFAASLEMGFRIGPNQNANIPDYYGDLPNDLNSCNGKVAGLICLLSLPTNFAFAYGPKNTNNNIWVYLDVIYNEFQGITTSDITISNYYAGKAILGTIRIDNGSYSHYAYNGNALMNSGFGADSTIPNSGGNYNGDNQVSFDIIIFHMANTPNGSGIFPNNLHFQLPSVPQVLYFLKTGDTLPYPPWRIP